MAKFEYQTKILDSPEIEGRTLTELGKEGWELIQVLPIDDSWRYRYILKREIPMITREARKKTMGLWKSLRSWFHRVSLIGRILMSRRFWMILRESRVNRGPGPGPAGGAPVEE